MLFAGMMAGAAVVAVLAAWLTARALGGDGRPALLAAACTAVAGFAALAPALFGPRQEIGSWGFVVVGSSMARMFFLLTIAWMLVPAGAPRPFWLGIVAGAGILLVAETLVAASFITRLDHCRAVGPAPEHAKAC
jgi:hypothetical protein